MSVKKIMITSCKGGVGKSTVTANLGYALAASGHKTLLVDCDFGIRSLDLILGVEDQIVYDIRDVVSRGIAFKKAVIHDHRNGLLDFCAAPSGQDEPIASGALRTALNRVAYEYGYEYILLDTPGDEGDTFAMAAAVAESALIVSTMQPTSIRAAERTGAAMASTGIINQKLLINCFDFRLEDIPGQQTVLDIIDKTYLQLIGIIPYDSRLPDMQARGALINELPSANVSVAFNNVAKRLTGRNVPLFTSFSKINRKNVMRYIRNVRNENF